MLRIAIITDSLTNDSLFIEEDILVKQITSLNYLFVFKFFQPDFLLVESAWQGHKNRWKYKISSYPGYPKRNNKQLQKIVEYAKKLAIPTVFWNKEDSVHFERFIDSAKLFDHIFTVDANAIERYRSIVPSTTTVNTLMFAVQPKFHYFNGFDFKYNHANFMGSYSHHIHDRRRLWQNMMFESANEVKMQIDVYDRNSDRKSSNYRYPKMDSLKIYPAVTYEQTSQIYKDYAISLNVNTIEDSPTMFSRRLIEILACGGIAVSNPSLSIDNYFKEYVHVVQTKEEMKELFYRIHKYGPTQYDLEMARAGAEYVAKYHTWKHRLNEIVKVIGM